MTTVLSPSDGVDVATCPDCGGPVAVEVLADSTDPASVSLSLGAMWCRNCGRTNGVERTTA